MVEHIDFSEETKELLSLAVEFLPDLDREVVLSVFYDREPQAAIARRLGVSDRTVGRALERSYAKMRQLALAAEGVNEDG